MKKSKKTIGPQTIVHLSYIYWKLKDHYSIIVLFHEIICQKGIFAHSRAICYYPATANMKTKKKWQLEMGI